MILLRSDGARIFVTALLVYAVFWNPWLQFSNSDNFVDAAVSLVDTGRWSLTHWPLYEGKDTATARDGRKRRWQSHRSMRSGVQRAAPPSTAGAGSKP